MKFAILLAVGVLFAGIESITAQDKGIPTGLVELLSNPQKFNDQIVTLHGYLQIEHEQRHGVRAILYLHHEDARHLLASNGILVLPNKAMLKQEEKINERYVTLTGLIRTVRAANGVESAVVKEVRSCTVWSDPGRPIGAKN
jgi:hypothetical protein